MYRWWVFVHLAGVFGFLVAHGVSVAVTFQLRTERDPRRVADLLQLSGSSIRLFYVSMGVLVGAGIVLGFLGDWWDQGWIWASLAVLALTSVAMLALARPYYRRVGLVARAMAGGSSAVSDQQFDEILRSGRSLTVAGIGFFGLALILYLMLFKPTLGLSSEPAGPTGPAATAEVTAEGIAFDTDRLSVPASEPFTIAFHNEDRETLHNVAVYTDRSLAEPLFVGELFAGPDTRVYRVDALEPGTYYFRCDVHPQMEGTLTAG